jgi:hypothetical protein
MAHFGVVQLCQRFYRFKAFMSQKAEQELKFTIDALETHMIVALIVVKASLVR